MELNETLDFNHGGFIMKDWRRLRKYAGTHLLEKCSHDIDLANWMVGITATRTVSRPAVRPRIFKEHLR